MSHQTQSHETEGDEDAASQLENVPEEAREALPDHLKHKLVSGEARLATEQDVLVDEDETWWVWEEVEIRGETMVVGFELRPITWQRKNQIFKNNVETRPDGSTKFEIDTFQREAAVAKVADHTIDTGRSLTQLLAGVDNNVGERLEPYLPDPGATEIEEDEEKN